MPTTHEMEEALRRLLTTNDLPAPDEIVHRSDGSILALWHDSKLAIVVDPEDGRDPSA